MAKLTAVPKKKTSKKKGQIIELTDTNSVQGFMVGFIEPINAVQKELQLRERYAFQAGFVQNKEDSYYIANLMYDGEVILTERIAHLIGDKAEQAELIEQVVYRVMLHFITAGMHSVRKAHEDGKEFLKEKGGSGGK